MKKMSNWLATGKFNAKDEYYTPRILVDVVLPYIKPSSTIWCPFDTENSEFVLSLTEAGHKVIYSHIWNGKEKPINQFNKNGEFIKRWDSIMEAAKTLRLNPSSIVCVCKKKRRYKSTGGWKFEYAKTL